MIMIPIFVILFCCILAAIKKMTLFEGNIQIVMAVCVTALCLIALQQMFVDGRAADSGQSTTVIGRPRPAAPAAEKDGRPKNLIPVILLPYAALALTLLLLPIVWLISVILRSNAWQRIRFFFSKSTHQKPGNYREYSKTSINRIPRGDR